MKEFIKKYEIWIFLIFGPILNAFFVLARSQGLVPAFVYNHGRFCVLIVFVVCLVKYTRGTKGVKDIFKPMLSWRVSYKWYVFAFLFAFSMGILTQLIRGIYEGEHFYSFIKVDFSLHFPTVIILLTWAFLGEVVWVSYCIRELSKVLKPFYASQIIGLVWALLFIPIAILGEGTLTGMPIIPLVIFILGIAGMCMIIYVNSRSGVCVLVLQFMLNMCLIQLSLSPSRGGVTTFTTYAIVYFLVMLVIVYFMDPIKKLRPEIIQKE